MHVAQSPARFGMASLNRLAFKTICLGDRGPEIEQVQHYTNITHKQERIPNAYTLWERTLSWGRFVIDCYWYCFDAHWCSPIFIDAHWLNNFYLFIELRGFEIFEVCWFSAFGCEYVWDVCKCVGLVCVCSLVVGFCYAVKFSTDNWRHGQTTKQTLWGQRTGRWNSPPLHRQ